MSRTARLVLALAAAAVLAGFVVAACAGLPRFGTSGHPYRDRAVAAAVRHATANVVSAVNFDQRALDTLGEETILLAATAGATVLLRPSRDEPERPTDGPGGPDPAGAVTRMVGYLLLPVTLVVGVDVVAHGAVTPGGGFQGGVVVATGVHLLFVAGGYPVLRRMRPMPVAEWADAGGVTVFIGLGLAALVLGGSFLANVLPAGTFTDLLSAGTVPLLSAGVGVEVTGGVVILLARFLEQAYEIGED